MQISKFLNAYEISISAKANTLEFETDNNLTYEIYAGPGAKIIPGFVFTSDVIYVGFFSKGKKIIDDKVMPTVMNFILDIFEDKNAILSYIHSPESALHKARERYFNKLYNNHNDGTLLKTVFNLGGEDRGVIIYRRDNININAIQGLTAEEIIARIEDKETYPEYHE